MNRRTKFLFICITVLFAFSALTVYAVSPRYMLAFKWPDVPCTLFWDCGTFTSSQRTAIQNAMHVWNAVQATDGSELLLSVVTTDSSLTDNQIFVDYIADSKAIAKTYPTPETGYLQNVIIRLSKNSTFTIGATSNSYDLQSVVMHELGHAYGIAHCHEEGEASPCSITGCPNNVMNRTLAKNTNRRVLTTYDIINYQYIYVS